MKNINKNNKLGFERQLEEYAVNELWTIDGIQEPTREQIKEKVNEVLSWPIFAIQAKRYGLVAV